METVSQVTCPECGHVATETMPTDACIYFYECTGCGNCCVEDAPDSCRCSSMNVIAVDRLPQIKDGLFLPLPQFIALGDVFAIESGFYFQASVGPARSTEVRSAFHGRQTKAC